MENGKIINGLSEDKNRWRLILGQSEEESSEDEEFGEQSLIEIDAVLDEIYSEANAKGGDEAPRPNVKKWLGDIRKYFPEPVIKLLQKDAMDKLGLEEILREPELMKELRPNVDLVGQLLALKDTVQDTAKDAVRNYIAELARQLEERLRMKMEQAVKGALTSKELKRNPAFKDIHWNKTIQKNLKHYQPEFKTIIPELVLGHRKKGRKLEEIIIVCDQSSSMIDSAIHSGVCASILATIPAVSTKYVTFSTEVADLTDYLSDPVDLLFGLNLGGGTDIGKGLAYANEIVGNAQNTTMILISDLQEGGSPKRMFAEIRHLKNAGVNLICLLAISDDGKPSCDVEIAKAMVQLEVPVMAVTPDQFPDLLAAAINKTDLGEWEENIATLKPIRVAMF